MAEHASDGQISLESVVVAIQEQVSSDLTDEKVILNVGTGYYFGLRGVGRRIWELLAEPRQVREVRDVLLAEYEVDVVQCEEDLLGILSQLSDRGLLQIQRADHP